MEKGVFPFESEIRRVSTKHTCQFSHQNNNSTNLSWKLEQKVVDGKLDCAIWTNITMDGNTKPINQSVITYFCFGYYGSISKSENEKSELKIKSIVPTPTYFSHRISICEINWQEWKRGTVYHVIKSASYSPIQSVSHFILIRDPCSS